MTDKSILFHIKVIFMYSKTIVEVCRIIPCVGGKEVGARKGGKDTEGPQNRITENVRPSTNRNNSSGHRGVRFSR